MRDGKIVRRSMTLRDFILGPGKTALADDEMLVAVECDALPGYGGSFEKVGHRRSLVISLVCLAVLVKLDAQGRNIDDVRLAIAGIGPVPLRLREIEDFLRGGPLSAARLEAGRRHAARRWCNRARGRNIAAKWCAASCCAG